MSALRDMKCVPCRGTSQHLTKDEIDALMPEIPEWTLFERNGVPRIRRTFRFRDFRSAVDFTNKVADIAEEEDHHPTILTQWGKVTVTLWTHAINGLHQNDFIMAARIDALLE
jgi:4a-hydroxytetrahydrobiopterin dehydratase